VSVVGEAWSPLVLGGEEGGILFVRICIKGFITSNFEWVDVIVRSVSSYMEALFFHIGRIEPMLGRLHYFILDNDVRIPVDLDR
jgi:hypothetical protein